MRPYLVALYLTTLIIAGCKSYPLNWQELHDSAEPVACVASIRAPTALKGAMEQSALKLMRSKHTWAYSVDRTDDHGNRLNPENSRTTIHYPMTRFRYPLESCELKGSVWVCCVWAEED